jgi:signal transduction histidine kinase
MRAWWPFVRGAAGAALERLWKHSVAVSWAARRLAEETGDADAERIGRVGLLHNLGLWAVAAVDPERLAELLAVAEPDARRIYERAWLGTDTRALGRALAEHWSTDPLLADATWLYADLGSDLAACAREPVRLALIQRAFAWAERTPWALGSQGSRPISVGPDPRLRLLIAEVQSRCATPFLDAASSFEEDLARSHAQLLLKMSELEQENAALGTFARAFAAARPDDGPAAWAEKASVAFASLPSVERACVTWNDPRLAVRDNAEPDEASAQPSTDGIPPAPAAIFPLEADGRRVAEASLWTFDGTPDPIPRSNAAIAAWGAWAGFVAAQGRSESENALLVEAVRRADERGDAPARDSMMEALAEFAAGAGHELNNPLAVIVGRAQLLRARLADPDSSRSLETIITQAQRAHRILRDLMYIARPPRARPRTCLPDEIVRASVRDLQSEAERRGVRLLANCRAGSQPREIDPDGLRHVSDTFIRNALEATPAGGVVRLQSVASGEELVLTIDDTGKGLNQTEAQHLFDPFFCGRSAGRGLGLGLPRAARFLGECGGRIRWKARPGRGTSFHITLPLVAQEPLSSARTSAEPKPHAGEATDCVSGTAHPQSHRIGDRVTVRT